MCVHVRIHMCVRTYIYIYTHIYTRMCAHMYICIHTYIYIYIHGAVPKPPVGGKPVGRIFPGSVSWIRDEGPLTSS